MKTSEAIKIIKGLIRIEELGYNSNPLSKEGEHITTEALTLAISALEKQEQDRWITVTKRLPEEDDYRPCYGYDDGAVWWLNDIGIMGLGWYYTSTEKWAFYDETTHTEGVVGNVTAWRPLPEPYTEEDNDNS